MPVARYADRLRGPYDPFFNGTAAYLVLDPGIRSGSRPNDRYTERPYVALDGQASSATVESVPSV